MPHPVNTQTYEFFQAHDISNIQFAYASSGFHLRKGGGFIKFDLKKRLNAVKDREWKFHFSIHPDDLNKAWDEVFWPIFSEQAISFKVTDPSFIRRCVTNNHRILKNAHELLDTLESGFSQFLEEDDAIKHSALLEQISKQFEGAHRHHTRSRIPHGISDDEYLTVLNISDPKERYQAKYALVIRYLKGQIQDITEALPEIIRMLLGMQVTVYIPPGEEAAYQPMAEKIEAELIKHKIRPGLPYRPDKVMGRYCSRRHPGLTQYHSAVTVGSYNPDDVDDPFKPIVNEGAAPLDACYESAPQVKRLRGG